LARKIFDQKIDHAKQSYAEAAGKFAENLAREEANQLESVKEKRMNTEKLLQDAKEENEKLQATLEKLTRVREENAKLKQQIKKIKPMARQSLREVSQFVD
jgi:cell shape-determining protein MreC